MSCGAKALEPYLVTTPLVVMRPIGWLPLSVNHRAPSGPVVIMSGNRMLGSVYVEITPEVVMRSIEAFSKFVNHKAPSGPAVMSMG